MAVVLNVDFNAWHANVDRLHQSLGDALIPVVKGNGYGFGRIFLAAQTDERGLRTIAVGTVHEVADVDATLRRSAVGADGAAALATENATTIIVLTPTLDPHLDALDPTRVVFTVGNDAHVRHLLDQGITTRPIVKLASSMQRYGFTAVPELDANAYAIHPPLAGDDEDHIREIQGWLPLLDPDVDVHLSHLSLDAFRRLQETNPARRLLLRSGTALWHGDRDALHLVADVLEIRAIISGQCVGYRQRPINGDGTLVMIGAGSAHGVAPLEPDQRSPFHFGRQRLPLVEAPHMHTSMAFVPTGQPCPEIREWVDVQRPLITTHVDRVEWH